MILGRLLRTIALFSASACLGAALAAPASASVPFNRTAAVAYANQYSCNGTTACRNAAFRSLPADCTNFVSQAIAAGGAAMEHPLWYYDASVLPGSWGDDFSAAWSTVDGFLNYWQFQRPSLALWYTGNYDKYSSAYPGDLYLYNWGLGEGYSHLSVSTGSGSFPNFSTQTQNGNGSGTLMLNYNSITSGSGSFQNQHTNDRWHAPWNLGYYLQLDSKTRASMSTLVVHWQ